jgi:chromosome partitioning protein
MAGARVIVVGNEKGGAGKSTLAILLGTALLHAGAKVRTVDLDLRQQSMGRFFASRRTWCAASGIALPMPVEIVIGGAIADAGSVENKTTLEALSAAVAAAAADGAYVIIDTPGGDTPLSRAAHGLADLILTPMNDSFVDFDLLGQVDPVTLDVMRPSLYAETVWEARKAKAATRGGSIDWVVLRNRLAPTEARNRRRLEERMNTLSRRIGFRMGPGLRDRVIYRELHPFGLTVADLAPGVRPVPVSMGHIVARQELRSLMLALGLSQAAEEPARAAS